MTCGFNKKFTNLLYKNLNKKIIHIIIIIGIIFAILCITGILVLRYQVEGETNMPFKISKISMIESVEGMEKDEQNGMSPQYMASNLYRIATRKNPKPIYVGGTIYKLFCLLNRLLPKRLVNWIVGKLYC